MAYACAGTILAASPSTMSQVYRYTVSGGTSLLVSASPAGAVGNNHSRDPAISGDGGSIAFRTLARNLDVGDPALNIDDVFVYRGASLPLKRVSYTQTGAHPDAWSAAPSLSRLGDYVVFTSRATDLITGDTNHKADIFRLQMPSSP